MAAIRSDNPIRLLEAVISLWEISLTLSQM
jgi:hypothetical protein